MATINAIETPLELFIGTDHRFVCTETAGTDMTGWALSFMIKRKLSDLDAAAVVPLTTPSNITISTSVATVTMADTNTDTLSAGVYRWELKRTDAGAETVVGYGPLALLRSVHRT